MGTIKTTNIETITGSGTLTLGQSGETITIPSGATLTNNGTANGFGLSGWSEDGANNNLLPASASAGIYLGVNSATAANLLDDYEEGTFTATSNTGTITSNFGKYTKIGDKVFCSVAVSSFSDRSTATSIQINGLPFAVKSGFYTSTASMHRYVNTGNGGDTVNTYLQANTTLFELYQCASNSNWNNVRHDHLSNSSAEFYFNFTYITN